MKNLQDKVAIVFSASGEIAGAVARSFAQHGAKVYVTGRNLNAVKALAEGIKADGGRAEAARVDALNETEVDDYVQKVVADNGKLDMVFNGIGMSYGEAGVGTPTTAVPLELFLHPFQAICGSQFLTSRTAAKYMIQTGTEGTILLLTPALSRSKFPNMAGITASSAAVEGLTRVMAAELGEQGIKVICICPNAILETTKISGAISSAATRRGVSLEVVTEQYTRFDILKGGPTLLQVGETAAFLVSQNGAVFNSHIVDVDCGKLNIL